MKYKVSYLFVALMLITGCADKAQMGNMRYAMEMLGKCNFVEAIEASNDAISMGKIDEKAYLASIAINAKSHEALKQPREANKAYLLLIENSPKVTNITQAKHVVNNLNALLNNCANI